MLYSLVIQLFPESDIVLPATLGRHAHAALLGMINQVDAELAQRVHDETGEKPFTVSPLQGKFERVPSRDGDGAEASREGGGAEASRDGDGARARGAKGLVRLTAGAEYWLRFTFLTDELYQAVSRFFLEAASPTVQLGEGRFVVARVTATGEQASRGAGEIPPSSSLPHLSRWSGHATFGQLWEEAPTRERLAMRFYSPTCFRVTRDVGRSDYVAEPELRLCVQSWLHRWNRFAPENLFLSGERLLDFVEMVGQRRRVNIATKVLDFGAYRQRGFVGTVEWVLACPPKMGFDGMQAQFLWKEIHALAAFAFYGGTGYKTTMGLGQSRRVDGFQRKDAKAQGAQR